MSATDEHLSEMLKYCLDFGRQMLEKSGEFHPFGAAIGPLGAFEAIGFWDGRENPPGAELYAYAIAVLKTKAESREIMGGAIAANVNVPPQFESEFPDGIRVQVEGEGYARLIYLPYKISKKMFGGRSVVYGKMFAVEIDPAFFL